MVRVINFQYFQIKIYNGACQIAFYYTDYFLDVIFTLPSTAKSAVEYVDVSG